MGSSDWASQATNQIQYSPAELNKISTDIAQRLQDGGKKKKVGYEKLTKAVLLKKVQEKHKTAKGLSSLTKEQLINKLRK